MGRVGAVVQLGRVRGRIYQQKRPPLRGKCARGAAFFVMLEVIAVELLMVAVACAVRCALRGGRYFDEQGLTDIPLFVSGTLVDQSGRTLSGQTTEVRQGLLRPRS